MPLFLVVREANGARTFSLQEAEGGSAALLRSSLGGQTGKVVSVDEIDDRSARNAPMAMRGRVLTESDVAALLKRKKSPAARPKPSTRG